MADSESKPSRYVDDFMGQEEEEYKVPLSVHKDRESFNKQKDNFKIENVLNQFVLKKELFISEREGDVYQYYDFTDEVLGEGAYGVVLKAFDKHTQKVRAIKKIPRSKIRNFQRFLNEVSALKTLDHPNIVKLFEVFTEEKNVFLVQEYLGGGELFDYITDQDHLSESEAANIFSQIIKSLIYCHRNKITHRDLKPENFMFKSKNKGAALKLIDFGLSRKFYKRGTHTEAQQFMRMKSKVGTEHYMSPEIIKRNYSSSCDVWSAGVLLYIMLCGCPPFDGDSEDEVMELVENIEYDFDDECFENVSDEVKDLIAKILVPEKDRMTLQEVLQHDWIKKFANKQENAGEQSINMNLIKKLKQFNKTSKLRKAVVTLIATQISDQDISEEIKLFEKFDSDMDGYINLKELKKGMQETTNDEILKIMESVDTDKNGEINYNEFISATMDNKLVKNSFSINKAFDFFDKDHNGQIERNELQQILQGSEMNHVETNIIKDILFECDMNRDGVIDRDEFYRCMSYKKPELNANQNFWTKVASGDVIKEEDSEMVD